ncbi:MAG TPA: prenyltransferase/squalene oxidase repeat-containing protein, partial [Gemmataceae bacterium]
TIAPARSHEAWLKYLRERQLTEELGWAPSDREYGGWGYARGVPRKPKPDEIAPPHLESNLSATLFALEALRAAKVPDRDPVYAKALTFVKRCQNWEEAPERRDPEFDDGGFHFIYADPVRNKAGVAGKDRHGRQRFHSYGSTTADGLRALLLCGVAPDSPRVKAARAWLEKHFRADAHPGKYAGRYESDRNAVYYYYAASVARALRSLGIREVATDEGAVNWSEVLGAKLVGRQRADGSWVNPIELVRENDPIVATCFAVLALAECERAK